MAPIHFELIKNILAKEGYRLELLTDTDPQIVEEGLKYVHNDTCYPATLVIGQFIHALKSGRYDLNRVALIMSQTGGGCRASNYIHLLRRAVANAGFGHIPVISANISGLESNPGFKISLSVLRKCIAALLYGDLLMLLSNQTRPYEIKKGQTDCLIADWVSDLTTQFRTGHGLSSRDMKQNLSAISNAFSKIPLLKTSKVKVGVVGEIYVKYAKIANNGLEEFLASQNCEVIVPGLMGFMLFKFDNRLEDITLYGGNRFKYAAIKTVMNSLLRMEQTMLDVLKEYPCFTAPSNYHELKGLVDGIIGYGNKMGEGWLLTAEMVELIEKGYGNIVCTQPFGCLPNHICGKGMIHRLHNLYPEANIVAVDYDPSATRVNQENRIKLMLSVAHESLDRSNPATGTDSTQI